MARTSQPPFFVVFGAEDFLLDRDIEKARRWTGRVTTLLNGEDLSERELVSICETPPLEESPRTVIVDDAHKLKVGKEDKVLREYIDGDQPPNLVLLVVVRAEKLPDIWALAAKKGKLVERKKLKTWDNNNEVVKWLETEAVRLGLTLPSDLARYLFQTVGSDLYRLANELRKISHLIGTGKVTKEHIHLVVAPSPTAEPWQVAEAAFRKDPLRALSLLSVLYRNEGDGANVPIANALMKQLEKLIVARQLSDKGSSEDAVAATLDMHPWRYRNSLLPIVGKHSLKSLLRHMGDLCRLDADLKGPASSKRTRLELALLSIAD